MIGKDDIIERLWIDRSAKDPLLYGERKEAAKEIERLRSFVEELRKDSIYTKLVRKAEVYDELPSIFAKKDK